MNTTKKVYVTQNSNYVIDEENMRYMRLPNTEKQVVLSHRLTYGEWHPLKKMPLVTEDYRLHILREDSEAGIYTSPYTLWYEL